MIDVDERGGRFYCGRPGCGGELSGLLEIGDSLAPSGWWSVLHDQLDGMPLLVLKDSVSRRRIKRRARPLPNVVPREWVHVRLPVVIECPRCKARQRIDVASPSQ